MNTQELKYLDLLGDIHHNGDLMENRTGTNTVSVVSRELRFALNGWTIPVITSKKMAIKAIFGEGLWFMAGSSLISDLRKLTELGPDDFCIWQQNFEEYQERRRKANMPVPTDDLGYIYGKCWRAKQCAFGHTTDQIANLIRDIKAVKENPSHPAARRLIVDTWDAHVHTDEKGLYCALPPCHYGFQCFVRGDKLTLKWIQRSVDSFLG